MEVGYWTDASSVDALSTCSDVEDLKPMSISSIKSASINSNVFSPATHSVYGVDCVPTPVNPRNEAYYQHPKLAYLIGISLEKHTELLEALKMMEIEFRFVTEADFTVSSVDSSSTIIIFEEFSGTFFDTLRKRTSRLRIYGPPVLIDIANAAKSSGVEKPLLPVSKTGYPIYSRILKNCRISVTGIKCREELIEIRRRILYLEGVYMEREGPLTHLVAARCRGNKYRDAVALDKPILKPEWVNFLWQHKTQHKFDITKDMVKFRVRAFYGAKIALDGFDTSEKSGMVKLIEENEGQCVDPTDLTATHIVKSSSLTNLELKSILTSPRVESNTLMEMEAASSARSPLKRARFELPVINDFNETDGEGQGFNELRAERAKVLKAEWFWTSIQIEACADENAYQIRKDFNEDTLNNTLNNSIGTPNSFSSPMGPFSDNEGTPVSSTPGSSSAAARRKRKRFMREYVRELAQVDHPKCIMEVDEDAENLDLVIKSPEQSQDHVSDTELAVIIKRIEKTLQSTELRSKMDSSSGKVLKRLNEYAHLVETEKNYVSILMNIIKLFKEPCEEEDQKAGRLLTAVEIKRIFDPIMPIYSLHKRILREMLHILENYTDESLIGQIYVKNAQEMRKCYEPFVEYFETVKNEIIRCEAENPRFMAFLRIAQGKPQCGKEKLVELIIRPVQRLPSTALILKSLEKSTDRSNPDFDWITKGVEAIDRVNQTINQKKERADSRVAMFDIFHEVEGCPVELISDHRILLKKYDVISMNDGVGFGAAKNDLLTLIVFTDHFQIVKRKNLGNSKHMSSAMSMANLRSPAVSRKSFMIGPSANLSQKRYKFLEWISFCHVKKIVNIQDMEPRCFAFIVREPEELRERFMMFTVPEDVEMERIQKISVVEFLAKQVAHSVARVDFEQFITTVDAATVRGHEGSTMMERAAKFASKTRTKVSRALSLKGTPHKLKRTMSQIMSPFGTLKPRDPDSVSQSGSEASITPMRNNLSTMSLLFKRGTLNGQSTPKTRRTQLD